MQNAVDVIVDVLSQMTVTVEVLGQPDELLLRDGGDTQDFFKKIEAAGRVTVFT